MTEVQGQMSDLIQRIAHPTRCSRRSNAQHQRLVALLRAGDTGRAVRLMREHCEGTEHILAALMPRLSSGPGTQVSLAPPPWPLFTTIEPRSSATRLMRRGEHAHARVRDSSA